VVNDLEYFSNKNSQPLLRLAVLRTGKNACITANQ
jgi:hypothetical protein